MLIPLLIWHRLLFQFVHPILSHLIPSYPILSHPSIHLSFNSSRTIKSIKISNQCQNQNQKRKLKQNKTKQNKTKTKADDLRTHSPQQTNCFVSFDEEQSALRQDVLAENEDYAEAFSTFTVDYQCF
jgi:hypothetical protein